MDAALETFLQEAEELLLEMEDSLLMLEDNPEDSEVINSVFRAMHTIKGSAGLFGFDEVVKFTHEAETVLDLARTGERDVDPVLISILLNCKDHTSKLLEFCVMDLDAPLPQNLQEVGDDLILKLTGKPVEKKTEVTINEIPPSKELSEQALADDWLISLEFKEDALRNGMDPLSFLRYLKTIGTIEQILTSMPDMPLDQEMNPESCYLHFKVVFKSDADKQTIEEVFEFAADDCDIRILPPNSKIQHYLNLLEAQSDATVEKLGDMLMKVGALTPTDIANALQDQTAKQQENPDSEEEVELEPLGEILVEQQVVQQTIVDHALKKQEQTKKKIATEASYIRVDSNKLGNLIDLVGELVISGAAMNLMVDKHGLADVDEVAESMNTLVSDIRDTALELRMVPIGETFSRFRRVVRDVSSDLNKEINLKIIGGETELDKTVVEKINDPLMHLIRNSLDHGIEMPEKRVAAGKTADGNIQLKAFHESGHIIIQIIDDGGGLNSERILKKAIANGVISEEHNLSQQEIFNLIFEAGLSTKDEASNLSGRGVGMDVVRRNIEALRGTVNINSIEGEGTTITIELPLTLAIIDGFMVETEQEKYIIPLTMVDECVEMDQSEWEVNEIQHYINLRGVAMPYLRLGDYFHNRTKKKESKRESLIVVRFGQMKAGFVVDKLHGEHQTVIKPMGKVFQSIKGITGATVLGDGNVALILDVQGLIMTATKSKKGL